MLLKTSTFIVALMLSAPPAVELDRRRQLEAAVQANEHDRVVEIASQLSESQPENAYVWYALGRSAFALNRHELAMRASERVLDLGYRYMPWVALRLARSAARLEREEAMYQWLQRALDLGLEDRQRMVEFPAFQGYLDKPRFRALAGLDPPSERAAGLVADIDYLVAEASRLHPAHHRLAPTFEAAAQALRDRAAGLGDRQFLYEVMALVALLGDGHSVVYGPLDDSPLSIGGTSLPILFYLFEEGLYVVDGVGAGTELIGRRVERIGRRTPQELLEYSRRLHGADNPMTMQWLGVHFYFPRTAFLLEAGAIDDEEQVPLRVTTADGGSETVVLQTGDHQFPRKLRAPKLESVVAPKYLQQMDRAYWFEPLAGNGVYFQFNQVRDAEDEPIASFARRLRKALAGPGLTNLVIDLRHNNGGNNGLLRPLLREIIAFDTRDDTRIFVIIGRNTFSAAQNFVNRLERLTDAVFVGEPSSSSPNFIGEETRVVLPWSRILVSISSRYWQDSDPGDQRIWIAPHIPVPQRADDYFAGRDAALEAIRSIIGP